MDSGSEEEFQGIRSQRNERRWRLSYLQKQFESLELHNLYNRYSQRIGHGYFSQFLSLQIFVVTIHFIILLVLSSNPIQILPDLILYGLISILSVITLIITDLYVKQHPRLLIIFTTCAFCIDLFANLFIPYYYQNYSLKNRIRPAYTPYLLISSYILFNIQNTLAAIAVGIFISVLHIVTLILVTYPGYDRYYQRLGSDAIYLICINGLGIYFRYMNEIVIRRTFLDRRSCVESTLQLKFEEEQETQLMSSIIPKHILEKVRTSFINKETGELRPYSFDTPHIDEHDNVSILFADIVNYTMMTTQLTTIELLETLNELFSRFDDAAEDLKVLRIKFLGDCYYCVAGLPTGNPPEPARNHAEACVDFGLQMIRIIGDIRQRRKLDINMRIGVHTGKINSGIIGSVKWQYDIWSTDVDIANKMETEGEAGQVHITRPTKDLLTKNYHMVENSKVVNGENTYLITPVGIENFQNYQREASIIEEISENSEPVRRPTIYIKRSVTIPQDLSRLSFVNGTNSLMHMPNGRSSYLDETNGILNRRESRINSTERRVSGNPRLSQIKASAERRPTPRETVRRTAFMNNNIKRYKERLEETNRQLQETIEHMRLSKFEQWFELSEMNRVSLTFKDAKSELKFISIPDPLFKYYLLSVIGIILLLYVIENLTLSRWETPRWEYYLTLGVILLILTPLSWTYYLWMTFYDKGETKRPKNKIVLFLYNTSLFITENVILRIIIYTVVYLLITFSVFTELAECPEINLSLSPRNVTIHQRMYLVALGSNTQVNDSCVIPWHMTETCALAIIMNFLFLRMYIWLKLLYASITVILYSLMVASGSFFKEDQTYNYTLEPQVSHIISVAFLTVTLHLVDRQTEYMNRLGHLWYKTLKEKQTKAANLRTVNKNLLQNILPLHVAELYMNVNRPSDDLYHQKHESAIMFASIVNFSVENMGKNFLLFMNQMILDFDTCLALDFGRPIEKIKIAKWTYMAACGLETTVDHPYSLRRDVNSHYVVYTHPVICILKFATKLMQKLDNLEHKDDIRLRIGISHGKIEAGVVGSKKPHYDIWGHAVNMASRMDTNGVSNKIQVLKDTAEVIEKFGYECEYRGEIAIKGTKEKFVSTYFVVLDDNYELKRRKDFD